MVMACVFHFQSISMSRIGFAVFGFGRAGHIHTMNIIRNPQVSLKWIVDIDETKAKDFVTENFLDTKVATPSDMEKVLQDPSVNAAVVTTPTHLHEEIVVRCLQAGKAVFCEKPVAHSLEAIGEKFLLTFGYPVLDCELALIVAGTSKARDFASAATHDSLLAG